MSRVPPAIRSICDAGLCYSDDGSTVTATLTHGDTVPSLNRLGTRGSHWAVTRAKRRWQDTFEGLLLASGLPRRLDRVEASAVLRFPVRRRRDEDNHAWLVAKSLGDALVNGRWLPDDTPEHFRFTSLVFDASPGPRRTTVTVTGWLN